MERICIIRKVRTTSIKGDHIRVKRRSHYASHSLYSLQVDTLGQFAANLNDAKIMEQILQDPNGLKSIMRPGDICSNG